MPAGIATDRLGTQQSLHEALRERALAQAGGAAQQQGMRQRLALPPRLQPRPMFGMPGQSVHACASPSKTASACVAACRTAAGDWLASITRKRSGSAAARSR